MDIINKCYRCGGEPRLKTIHSYFYRVECSCGVIQNNLFQIQNLAIIDWNRFQQHYITKMKPLGNDNGNNQANQKEVTTQKLTDAACRARIMRMKPDSLITIYEVARLCRSSSETIYLAIKKGELPYQYKPGKRKIRVVKKSDAISWRREHPPIKEEIREYINDILG
jgi:predicted DNA-binding transcriptional regulator AlpA